jgi:hypothetical protein
MEPDQALQAAVAFGVRQVNERNVREVELHVLQPPGLDPREPDVQLAS